MGLGPGLQRRTGQSSRGTDERTSPSLEQLGMSPAPIPCNAMIWLAPNVSRYRMTRRTVHLITRRRVVAATARDSRFVALKARITGRSVLARLTLCTVIAFVVPSASAHARTYVNYGDGRLVIKPLSWGGGSGIGGGVWRAKNMRWTYWGAKTATARGTVIVNTCEPMCASGNYKSYSARFRLHRPRRGCRASMTAARRSPGASPSSYSRGSISASPPRPVASGKRRPTRVDSAE